MNDELETNTLEGIIEPIEELDIDEDSAAVSAKDVTPLHSHDEDEEDLLEEDVDEVDFDVDEDDQF